MFASRSMLAVVIALAFCSGFPRSPASAAVLFDFSTTDGSDTPGGGGFFDPLTPSGIANAAALSDAALNITSLLDHTAIIEISVSTFSDAGDGTLATAGGFFYVDPSAMGVVPNAVQEEILFGAVTPGVPDGFLKINTAKSYYSGADASMIGPSDKDLRSVFLHELTHTLGWSSAVKADGTSGLTDALIALDPGMFGGVDELFTLYDTLLVDTADTPLIDLGTEDFDTGTLPLMGVLIDSTEAFAAAGGSIPTIVTPFGLDATHLAFGPFDTIMNPGLPDAAIKRTHTPIDIGVLKDLGYMITAVPEPGTGLLMLTIAPLGWMRRRSRL